MTDCYISKDWIKETNFLLMDKKIISDYKKGNFYKVMNYCLYRLYIKYHIPRQYDKIVIFYYYYNDYNKVLTIKFFHIPDLVLNMVKFQDSETYNFNITESPVVIKVPEQIKTISYCSIKGEKINKSKTFNAMMEDI